METVLNWVDDSDAPMFFQVWGKPGGGKTTLVRTICRRLEDRHYLVARVFFAPDGVECQPSTSEVIPLIVHQLCSRSYHFWAALRSSYNGADISMHSLEDQAQILLSIPFKNMSKTKVTTIITLDALDKYADRVRLIAVLRDISSRMSFPFKVLITCRQALDFVSLDIIARSLNLGAEPDTDVDIQRYLVHHLQRLSMLQWGNAHWPTATDIIGLVNGTRGLFMHAAATVAWLASQPSDLVRQLKQTLESSSRHPTLQQILDGTYSVALNAVASASLQDIELRKLLSTIVVLAEPVIPDTIQHILPSFTKEKLQLVSSTLSGILISSYDDNHLCPVYIVHASFLDFIADPVRCKVGNFMFDMTTAHLQLSWGCLSLAVAYLQRRSHPANGAKEYERYALIYWMSHLSKSKGGWNFGPIRMLLLRFCNNHLNQWIETLGAIGCRDLAIQNFVTSTKHWEKV
jgi:hypothetical protein